MAEITGTECNRPDTESRDWDCLLRIFPEEIWLLVLACVEDLTKVANASLAFREMLKEKKVEYLFPDVWNIIGVSLHKEAKEEWAESPAGEMTDSSNDDDDDDDDDSTDDIYWLSGILRLRLVHRAWKEVIDQFYYHQQLPAAFEKKAIPFNNSRMANDTIFDWDCDTFDWQDETFERLTRFLAHFEPTHENGQSEFSPLFCRRVGFFVPTSYDAYRAVAFDRDVFRLLNSYGRHIRICYIVFNITDQNEFTVSNLPQWLSLLPNLVSLDFFCLGLSNVDVDVVAGALQPLPRLARLEYLEMSNFAPAVANVFLAAYNHVSILHIHSLGESVDVTTSPFPNLEDLVITFRTMADFWKLEAAQFSSSFRNLDVTFIDVERLPLPEIFAFLERKWAASLKRLTVTVLPPQPRVGEMENITNEIVCLKRQHFPDLEEPERFIG